MTAANNEILLKIEDLHLSFGGVKVLNEIDLAVKKGDIHSIIGPNGAGKTSLLNCINMHYRPQRGSISFDGKELNRLQPHAVATCGIARTFQKVELFHGMSVLDNIKLGRHFLMKSSLLGSFFRLPHIVRDEMKHREEIEEEVNVKPSQITDKLAQQFVNEEYDLRDDYIDEDEEDLVEARYDLCKKFYKKLAK